MYLNINILVFNMDIQPITIDPNYRCGCPFHGDNYTLNVVNGLMKKTDQFIETGTGWGDTIYYMGNNYNIPCISCETDTERYNKTSLFTKDLINVKIHYTDSVNLLGDTSSDKIDFTKKTLFWLDAHGSFTNKDGLQINVDPIHKELVNIFKNFNDIVIMIDDFKNPFHPNNFAYDVLGKNELSIDYIRHLIPKEYYVYCPTYTNNTSKCCVSGSKPVGWCVITKDILNYNFLKSL